MDISFHKPNNLTPFYPGRVCRLEILELKGQAEMSRETLPPPLLSTPLGSVPSSGPGASPATLGQGDSPELTIYNLQV